MGTPTESRKAFVLVQNNSKKRCSYVTAEGQFIDECLSLCDQSLIMCERLYYVQRKELLCFINGLLGFFAIRFGVLSRA